MPSGAPRKADPSNPGAALMLVNSMTAAPGLVRGAIEGPALDAEQTRRNRTGVNVRQLSANFFLLFNVCSQPPILPTPPLSSAASHDCLAYFSNALPFQSAYAPFLKASAILKQSSNEDVYQRN